MRERGSGSAKEGGEGSCEELEGRRERERGEHSTRKAILLRKILGLPRARGYRVCRRKVELGRGWEGGRIRPRD